MMAFRDAKEYGYVNARIRGMKSRFLTVRDYEELIQAKNYGHFLKKLSTTYYASVIGKDFRRELPMPADLAVMLSKDFADVLHTLSKGLTGRVREFTQSYLDMYLAESLKSIIRGVHAELDANEILRYMVPTSDEQAEVFSELLESATTVVDLIESLPYEGAKRALSASLPAYEEFGSTAPLEVALEEWFLGRIRDALEAFGEDDQERVYRVLETRVVLKNALDVLRALSLAIEDRIIALSMVQFTSSSDKITESLVLAKSWNEVFDVLESTKYRDIGERLRRIYDRKRDLVEVEIALEDYLAQTIKNLFTLDPFNLGIVYGFFSLKYLEIKNIQSIAVGIERGESANVIRNMITIW
jgi:V/A-type H+-transporting ATPase subunit C